MSSKTGGEMAVSSTENLGGIRWAIVGSGAVVQSVLSSFGEHAPRNFLGITSRNRTQSKEIARKFGLRKVWESAEELCRDSEVEAVYVATPHHTHFVWSAYYLSRGFPVFCEKPVCLTESAVRELVDIATSQGIFFGEALKTPFLSTHKLLQSIIESDEIGAIQSLSATFSFNASERSPRRLFDPVQAGGSLYDLGSYVVWLATSILGPVSSI